MHSIKKYILGAMFALLASSPALADPGPWVETKTPLAGSATFTGTARYLNPLGAGATSATFFGVHVYADQSGTAYIDVSDDAATWNTATSATLVANAASDLSVPIRSAYYRVRVVNDISDETVLRVFSSQTQSGPGGSSSGGGGTSDATHAEQLNQLTQETKTATALGTPADAACTSDSATCALIAQMKLLLARASSIITQLTTLNTTATGSVPCRSASTTPTAVSDAAVNAAMCDLVGKLVTVPFQFQEFWVGGTTTSTDTSAHTLLAAQGASVKIYVTHLHCWREDAGTTQIHATLNDTLTTPFGIPAGGEFVSDFTIPLEVAANTALTFTMSSGVTTAYCAFRGYKGR